MRARFPIRMAIVVTALVAAASSFLAVPGAGAAETPPLARGDRGPAVVELQRLLATAGFDPGPIDGVFGTRTDAAVRRLQTDRSLPVTGIVDAATLEALGVPSAPLMSRGDRGPRVLDLQRRLVAAGHDPGRPDGIYGARTVAAVTAFQTAVGFTPTGAVDQATWDRLVTGGVLFRIGDRGNGVTEIQRLLGTLGFNPGPSDGKFGLRTEAALRDFQAAQSIALTGEVDLATLKALRAAGAAATTVLLERGDSGPEVLALQTRLARVGLAPGALDGKYGLRTAAAVARFQRTFNLAATGAVDQTTLTRLAAYEVDAERGYAAGYVPGGGAEQWRGLVTEVFARWGLDQEVCADPANPATCIPGQIDNAIAVMKCESNGVPFVVNVTSGVTGLFQHRLTYWAGRVARVQAVFPDFPGDASPYEPEHDAMVAALLVSESRSVLLRNLASGGTIAEGPHPWSHWSCRRATS